MTCEDKLRLAEGEVKRLTESLSLIEKERDRQRRREAHLQHLLSDALGETQAAKHGEKVLARFNATFSRRLRWIPDGTNARIISRAIRCYDSPEEGVQACLEAIDGLACKPYVVNGKRASQGSERQRYDDLRHALGGDAKNQVDEEAIRRFSRYAREAHEEGRGIPRWGPVVSVQLLNEALEQVAAKDVALGLLREFVETQEHYIGLLERKTGVQLHQVAMVAA